MFLLKFMEDKIAVGRSVYTCLLAALVTPRSLAQELHWQSQNRLKSKWLNFCPLKVLASLLNTLTAYFQSGDISISVMLLMSELFKPSLLLVFPIRGTEVATMHRAKCNQLQTWK